MVLIVGNSFLGRKSEREDKAISEIARNFRKSIGIMANCEKKTKAMSHY